MELRKKIKKDALVSLRNSWGKATAILLFICGVHLLFLLLEQFFGSLLHISFLNGGGNLDLYMGTLEVGTPFALMAAAFALISFIVAVPLQYGATKWYLRQVGGDSPALSTIFDCFHSIRRFFCSLLLKLAIGVRVLGVGILAYLPSAAIFVGIRYIGGYESPGAIIARLILIPLLFLISLAAAFFVFAFSLRYFLARYLFVSGHKSVSQCIKLSVRGMKGNIQPTLSFYLSFLPWLLLTPLLVPCLFIYPYIKASLAIYAKYLMTKLERNS